MYNSKDFTWGFELELSDVPKDFPVNPALGKWESAECDILNTLPPYRGICADPLGIDPPVGGEINVNPTKTKEEQVSRIMRIVSDIKIEGYTPNISPTAHSHIHVFVPGLKDDPEGLKRLMGYIKDNQHAMIDAVYGFYEHPEMKNCPKAKTYLKLDGGRTMPDWQIDNIIKNTTDFDSFILQHQTGKDAVSRGRPIRYGINTYCMKQVGTIEFRCFRGTLHAQQLMHSFDFVNRFMEEALCNPEPVSVRDILNERQWNFPKMQWDLELMQGWVKTKKDPEKIKGLKKNRELLDAS
ncbi:MAG: hypothetical protein ACO2ZZ_13605 [Cyclobacteriaceae bacterium]